MNDLKISIQKKIRQALIHKRPKIVPGDQTSKYTYTGTNAHAVMLDNVTYYPKYNTVFDSQGRLILESVKGHFKPEKYSLRKLHLSSKDEIDGICSVFRSMFRHSNYYHTVIDHLPRLYLIKNTRVLFKA
ncbi:hypothetical protein [Halomicronema sp. CCY15110]|uniref:hypothetical protein n=1 Tax=Halomicronema sp. CCY15110 TaxID=2767773 RepID=UPI00194E2466|nr:hypothetical protein [Halomicronema sp. CCY15110]